MIIVRLHLPLYSLYASTDLKPKNLAFSAFVFFKMALGLAAPGFNLFLPLPAGPIAPAHLYLLERPGKLFMNQLNRKAILGVADFTGLVARHFQRHIVSMADINATIALAFQNINVVTHTLISNLAIFSQFSMTNAQKLLKIENWDIY